MTSYRKLARYALVLAALAGHTSRARATEYFLSDFSSAAETNLGVPPAAWEYNNTDLAPWTASWDNASSLVFNFGLPLAPGENHRLRAPLTAPLPAFATYPYTKVKVTFSGIPTGQTVLFQVREEVNAGGYIKRTWPAGNGTNIYTFDATDTVNFDGGSNQTYNAATDQYKRVRLQLDLTTVPTYTTDYANIHASIDWVVVTDDPNYGASAEGEGEGEGASEGEGEGEGEGEIDATAAYTAELGQDITFHVSNAGNATPNGFAWHFTPAAGGSPVLLSETSADLSLQNVIYDDSGSYRADFSDGSKVARSYTAVLNVVAQVPLAGDLALLAVSLAVGASGAVLLRRRTVRTH